MNNPFKRPQRGGLCNHRWKDVSYVVLRNEIPRRIQKCVMCGVVIHSTIFTLKSLAKKEMEEVNK